MSVRAWWSRLRGTLRRRDAIERDMDREMAFHLEMATRRNMERGMSRDAAARAARLAFGSMEATREAAREAQRARVAENVATDVRFAFRGLRRSPTFAFATILTMALGIAASTAIFSVVDAVLLRPLPIPDPEDFTYLGWTWENGGDVSSLSAFQYEFVRANDRSFAAVGAFGTREMQVGDSGDAAPPLRGLRVNGDFFRAIGFTPRLGRAFDSTEYATGDPSVVILGDATWRARFGADPGIVGHQVRLDGAPRTVIGVMPADYRFPPAVDNDGFLVPYAVQADPGDEGHNTAVIARLRHGAGDAARDAALRELSDRFRATYPSLAGPRDVFKTFDHRDVYVGGERRTLWLLFGAVGLLMLIACANTATLLLVRASARQREIAVRASIGAGPARILQQLLTEGLVLALLSAALGVLLGVLMLRGFLTVAPSALPSGLDPRLDGRVFGFAALLAAVTGVVFGLAAAVPSLRLRVQSALLGGLRGATGGGTRTREALVFLEATSAVVLLAGATLLATSFARLMQVDPGFDAGRVVAVRLGRLPSGYTAGTRGQLIDRLLERIRQVPGVERAAAAPNLPLERGLNFPVDTREHPELAIGAVELRSVSPDYFATLGISLAGRDFSAADVANGEPVAIVNQAFARRFWGAGPAIGHTIQVGHYKDHWLPRQVPRQIRVVGMAGDMHELGLDRAPRPTVLMPRTQAGDDYTSVLLVRGNAAGIGGALGAAIAAVDPQVRPQVEPLSAVVSRSVAGPRFRMLLIGAFAVSALLLAAIGIYGVIASVVQKRTREIGIRLSLGASRATVVIAVARRCLVAVGAGGVAGLATFWALRRSLASMLYGTSPGDPGVLALVVIVLVAVAALAAWIPARRAARVDPAIALRLD